MKIKTKILLSLALLSMCICCIFLTSCGGDSLTYELSENGEYYIVSGFNGSPTEVTIPETYEGLPVKAIGDEAFSSCESLTSITLPEGITTIGSYAFYSCSSLSSIDLPDSLQELSRSAFSSNPQLVEEVDGVYYINDWALYFKEDIPSITFREGTVGIASGFAPDYIDSKRPSLNELKIPDSVKIIGSEAFRGTNLSSVNIPSSVEYIGSQAFDSTDLTSLVIPNGVKYIGVSAFGNTFLTTVTVPSSVEYIGYGAFMHHSGTNINDGIIYCEASEKPSEWDEEWCASYPILESSEEKAFTVVWGN